MADSKKFYWIKLKTNFFSREDIDFLLSQKNGAEYVVLYQMLCLITANNDGRLESKIGEILVPYNAEKIARDCKHFDIDTVNIAMALYKKLGLIYEEEDTVLKISHYDEMVGSETAWAEKKRLYRQNQKLLDNVGDKVKDNVRQENRDKSIEYRDIDNRDNNINNIEQNLLDIKTSCKKSNMISTPEIKIEKEIKKEIELNNIEENSLGETAIITSKKVLDKQLEEEFDKLWKYYPNKKGKEQAKNKYILARKQGTTYEEIADGLKRFIIYCKAEKIEEKFIKHGSTWFNQKCWQDEYKTSNNSKTKKNNNQNEILKGIYNGTFQVN